MQIRVNSSVKQRKDYINEQKAHGIFFSKKKAHGNKPRDGFWNIDNIYSKFK